MADMLACAEASGRGKRHLGGVEHAEGERWMGLALRLPSIHQLASRTGADLDTDNNYQFWWFEDDPPATQVVPTRWDP